jgi:flagellar motor protein MotB
MAHGKKAEAGGHGGSLNWLWTYADMITLLLGMFVILAGMSEMKRPTSAKYKKAVESIQRAFGMTGTFGGVPANLPRDMTPNAEAQTVSVEKIPPIVGETTEVGADGRHNAVKTIREGEQYVIGAPIAFEPGTARIRPGEEKNLMRIANLIRGLTFKVELRGHTSTAPLPTDAAWKDHMDLAYQRSKVVLEWLTDPTPDHGRLERQRLRCSSAGADEPVVGRAYEKVDLERNDRVDVMVTGALAQEFAGDGAVEKLLANSNGGQ